MLTGLYGICAGLLALLAVFAWGWLGGRDIPDIAWGAVLSTLGVVAGYIARSRKGGP